MSAWRTIIINEYCDLRYKDGLMVAYGKEHIEIAVSDIKMLYINSQLVNITACLISELIKRNVRIVFCDETKTPLGEVVGMSGNCYTAGRLEKQAKWSVEEKGDMWRKIVSLKILAQASLLDALKMGDKRPYEYAQCVNNDDSTNREGLAARVYFNRLFGPSFVRQNCDIINAALNYGYAILRSLVAREIVKSGYNNALGIKHRSETNSFNLTYDLLEPFRPAVDRIVYKKIKNTQTTKLTDEQKLMLIGFQYEIVKYDGKRMECGSAIEFYINEVLKNIGNNNYELKRLEFIDA